MMKMFNGPDDTEIKRRGRAESAVIKRAEAETIALILCSCLIQRKSPRGTKTIFVAVFRSRTQSSEDPPTMPGMKTCV